LGEERRILTAVKAGSRATDAEEVGANRGVFMNMLVIGDAAHADDDRGCT
jgi:hypothetical protein